MIHDMCILMSYLPNASLQPHAPSLLVRVTRTVQLMPKEKLCAHVLNSVTVSENPYVAAMAKPTKINAKPERNLVRRRKGSSLNLVLVVRKRHLLVLLPELEIYRAFSRVLLLDDRSVCILLIQ